MTAPVPGVHPDDPSFVYDEFAYFGENCAEFGLPDAEGVVVERVAHVLSDGRQISALRWGTGEPEVVLVHGGAQNAHTWDTVALALRPTPLLAIDLPGHGRSSWRDDRHYDPVANAEDLAQAITALAPRARVVVGMSLGGLTAIALTGVSDVVRRLVLVDITPGVNAEKAKAVHDFIAGPQSFDGFGEIFDRTVEFNPTRSPGSLRRGILHNAHRTPDGSWEWNYDRRPLAWGTDEDAGAGAEVIELPGPALWADLAATTMPIVLARGSLSPVVDDDDVAELRRLRPDATVIVVDGAGHSIQGDRPLELAEIIQDQLDAG
jgi:pimeloyl-ACP methyl ester carboxylesterase